SFGCRQESEEGKSKSRRCSAAGAVRIFQETSRRRHGGRCCDRSYHRRSGGDSTRSHSAGDRTCWACGNPSCDERRNCSSIIRSAPRRFAKLFAIEEASVAGRRYKSGYLAAACTDEKEAVASSGKRIQSEVGPTFERFGELRARG